jgi:hypothetical protein
MARRAGRAEGSDGSEFEVDALPPEAPRARRRRLTARDAERKAEEIDRNASPARLERAAKRLKSAHAEERVLAVPQWNMDIAVDAMRRAGVSGVVTNLSGTRRQRVECDEKRRVAVERTRVDLALDAALDEQLLDDVAMVESVLRDAEAAAQHQDKAPYLTVVSTEASEPALVSAIPPAPEPVVPVTPPEPVAAGERPSLELVVENEDVSFTGRLKRAIAKVGGARRSKDDGETRPTRDGRGRGRERA